MILRPKLTKMPGELVLTKADKYTQNLKNLTQLTKVQLLEIKEREEKLLSKKFQLARLPDKGQKIKDFYEKVLKEILQRDEIDAAARLFSDLNIASTGQEKLNNLEWTGKLNSEYSKGVILDSDDEEIDPLKIIAQSTDRRKHVKYIEPENILITEDDLNDIEQLKNEIRSDVKHLIVDSELIDLKISTDVLEDKIIESTQLNDSLSSSRYETASSNSSLNLEPHALYLLEKSVDGPPKKEKFLPYKTTKSNVHDPEKEKNRKIQGKYWEITAATPPPMQHNGVQFLSLKDSIEIQSEYIEKLKTLQEKQAEERLAVKAAKHAACDIILPDEQIRKVNKFFGSYRTHDLSSDESDNEYECDAKFDSDEGVRDDEEERGGCVNFKVCE